MFKKIREKLKAFDEFHSNGLMELAQDMYNDNPDDLLNCEKCGKKLGLWKMVLTAFKVERGQYYKVVCKYCKHLNVIRRSKKQ